MINAVHMLKQSTLTDSVLHEFASAIHERRPDEATIYRLVLAAYRLGQIDEGMGVKLPYQTPEEAHG